MCIDDFEVNDELRVLPCNHMFHKACIDPWLLERYTCPLCKRNILEEPSQVTVEQTNTNRECQGAHDLSCCLQRNLDLSSEHEQLRTLIFASLRFSIAADTGDERRW